MGCVLRVAVPCPLRRSFEYLPPDGADAAGAGGGPLAPGARVKVPFGRSTRTGVILGAADEPEIDPARLRRIEETLDEEPSLPAPILQLLTWAADYYHHPIGEAIQTALPVGLRRGRPSASAAPASPAAGGADEGGPERPGGDDDDGPSRLAAPNDSQAGAIDAILEAEGSFRAFLLDGVTGSGKTEVYFAVIDRLVRAGGQALVLVPEIGLTPQLVARFRAAFPFPLSVLHSGMTAGQRLRAWRAARDGESRVVVGTRSAIFTPLPRPAAIIVDEEHDPSYKQQDGFRYSARDLALMRGWREGVPVVLGSATPSLETLRLAASGRCRRLHLAERATGARMPAVVLHDVRRRPLSGGLSERLTDAIDERLERAEQTLLFVNRRGFAPVVLCHHCGGTIECRHCDARLVLHRAERRMRCHHCGAREAIPDACPGCGAPELTAVGSGTQRLTESLASRFPAARIVRVDRDSTRRRGEFDAIVRDARDGKADILVGTQMLAKGHDFPRVTLVGVVDADGGLFSIDFRAPERVAQLVTQVAGRAGRGDLEGEVLVQTRCPDHPLLTTLVRGGYPAFAEQALAERAEARLPPFSRLALLRAEAKARGASLRFLATARRLADDVPRRPGVEVMDPVPAPMERQGGWYRSRMLLRSASRTDLGAFLGPWMERLEEARTPRGVRWSLDVDPIDLG